MIDLLICKYSKAKAALQVSVNQIKQLSLLLSQANQRVSSEAEECKLAEDKLFKLSENYQTLNENLNTLQQDYESLLNDYKLLKVVLLKVIYHANRISMLKRRRELKFLPKKIQF